MEIQTNLNEVFLNFPGFLKMKQIIQQAKQIKVERISIESIKFKIILAIVLLFDSKIYNIQTITKKSIYTQPNVKEDIHRGIKNI